MDIKVKKLSSTATLPKMQTNGSAGYDLYADIPGFLVIKPHTKASIPTGVAMSIPEGFFGGIFPRSGLATKQGLRLANCVGVIDPSYTGEVIAVLYNDSNEARTIMPQERIAQLIILPCEPIEWTVVDELEKTERGEGGFGSTGL